MKTIKVISVLAMLVCSSQLLVAQGARFGLKGGYNLAKLQIDDELDTKNRSAYQFGAFVRVPLADKLMLEPALLYSSKGGMVEWSESYMLDESTFIDYYFRSDIKLNYLEVPVTLSYYLTDGFYASVSPYMSFLLKDKIDAYSGECIGGNCTAVKETVEDESDFSKTDYGIGVGLGYDITKNLYVNAQYQFGMKQIVDDEVDVFNRSLAITVGFSF